MPILTAPSATPRASGTSTMTNKGSTAMRYRHFLPVLAAILLFCTVNGPVRADPLKIKPGTQFDFSATACVTEDAGRAIVAAGKKTGSGYSTFMALKAQGICGRVETPATLVRVLDTFTDVAIGPVALAELTVTNGTDTKTLYGLMTPSEIDLSSI